MSRVRKFATTVAVPGGRVLQGSCCERVLFRAGWLAVTFAIACTPTRNAQSVLQAREDVAVFSEVEPTQPVPKVFATKLAQALELLQSTASQPRSELQGKIARATYERISDGSVQLDTLTGALPQDLYHMCRDLHMDSCGEPQTDPRDFRADAALRRRILSN